MSKAYAVGFEKTPTGWSACAPDLPRLGVVGKSFAETQGFIHDGTGYHMETLREAGIPIPKPAARLLTMAVAA